MNRRTEEGPPRIKKKWLRRCAQSVVIIGGAFHYAYAETPVRLHMYESTRVGLRVEGFRLAKTGMQP